VHFVGHIYTPNPPFAEKVPGHPQCFCESHLIKYCCRTGFEDHRLGKHKIGKYMLSVVVLLRNLATLHLRVASVTLTFCVEYLCFSWVRNTA
jgi:hypothetical protein